MGGGGGGGVLRAAFLVIPQRVKFFAVLVVNSSCFSRSEKKRPKSWLTRIAKFPPEVLNLNVPGTSTPVYLLTHSLLSAGDRYRFSLYNIPTVVWLGWTGYTTLQSLQQSPWLGPCGARIKVHNTDLKLEWAYWASSMFGLVQRHANGRKDRMQTVAASRWWGHLFWHCTIYTTIFLWGKPLITPVIAAAALPGRHTCAGRLQRPRLFTLSMHFARAARRKT